MSVVTCNDCENTAECEDRGWQKLWKIGWRKQNNPCGWLCPEHAPLHADAY